MRSDRRFLQESSADERAPHTAESLRAMHPPGSEPDLSPTLDWTANPC